MKISFNTIKKNNSNIFTFSKEIDNNFNKKNKHNLLAFINSSIWLPNKAYMYALGNIVENILLIILNRENNTNSPKLFRHFKLTEENYYQLLYKISSLESEINNFSSKITILENSNQNLITRIERLENENLTPRLERLEDIINNLVVL